MSIIATKAVRLGWRVVPFKKAIRPIVRRVVATRAMPGCWLRSFRLYKILAFDYGYLRSAATFRSIDAAGNPLPWITYPAIDFLRQMDLSEKSIFEYGCGGSTLFLSAIAPSVHSVENNPEYYREFRPLVPSNCTLLFEPGEEEFIQAVSRHGPYDVIMI